MNKIMFAILMNLPIFLCANSVKSPINVFILTGQSNSLGIIKDGEPLELKEEKEDRLVKFFWIDRDHASKIVSTSQDEIKNLQVQMFDTGEKNGHWGLEMSCFRQLSKSKLKNVLLVKVSRGGGGSSLWLKDNKDHHMYSAIIEAMQKVENILTAKKQKYVIRGLLYLQGESDGGDSSIADKRAEILLQNLRKDLSNGSKMKMYIGGIAGSGAGRDLVRAKHQELAEKNPDIYFINTDDLRKNSLYKDQLHFNNAAKLEIGYRFAKTILESFNSKGKK